MFILKLSYYSEWENVVMGQVTGEKMIEWVSLDKI